jgi:3-oxoadipate enol-lactonase
MEDHDFRLFIESPPPEIHFESTGDGDLIVLCHGITASRRYVLHGSRALQRAGHRVVTYDARGHGESAPAPEGEGYGYPYLVRDLDMVVAAEASGSPFVLGGHSMGAHTAVAYALKYPERVQGLVVIGPVYTGEIREDSLPYWDGLADALERDGIDGFVAYIEREQGVDAPRGDSILGFTRARMELHQNLGAVVDALREVPRSRPFDSLRELQALEMPALVVASHDDADPGHPYAAAVAYAEALPNARLISEEKGESPLAWQGGKLSREIVDFCRQFRPEF